MHGTFQMACLLPTPSPGEALAHPSRVALVSNPEWMGNETWLDIMLTKTVASPSSPVPSSLRLPISLQQYVAGHGPIGMCTSPLWNDAPLRNYVRWFETARAHGAQHFEVYIRLRGLSDAIGKVTGVGPELG